MLSFASFAVSVNSLEFGCLEWVGVPSVHVPFDQLSFGAGFDSHGA